MDWQLVIAINLMVISVVFALNALRIRLPGYLAIVGVHALVVGAGLIAWWFAPHLLLVVVAVPFTLLVLVPLMLHSVAYRAARRGDAAQLERFSRYASWLQPRSRDGAFAVALSAATRQANDADVLVALEQLEAGASRDEERALVCAFKAARQQDWTGVLRELEPLSAANVMVAHLRLRALGEVGRLDEMFAVYERVKTRLIGLYRAEALLFLFAFSGRPAEVERLLSTSLREQSIEVRRYWIARARRRANIDDASANASLRGLVEGALIPRVRVAAARVLEETSIPPPSPPVRAAIDRAAERFLDEAAQSVVPWRRLYATLGIGAVNLIMFAVSEWQGGSENVTTLWQLGALWPPSIATNGEWWRLLTATVLHFGPIHLALNIIMLAVFGRIVEARTGSLLMLVLYLTSAVGSSAAVYLLMQRGMVAEGFLVGASGAIFGLVGIMLAFDLAAWMRSRDRLDGSRVTTLLALLVLQMVVDVSVPNISFAGHASGLLIGVLLGGLVALLGPQKGPLSRGVL